MVTAKIPAIDGEPARVLRWGDQLDVRPITMDGELTDRTEQWSFSGPAWTQ